MASTFGVDSPVSFSALDNDSAAADDDKAPEQFVYTRWANPTIRQLEAKLAIFEGAVETGGAALAFASGMGATTALLLGRLSAGDHLVCGDVNYAGTAELARTTLKRMGIEAPDSCPALPPSTCRAGV